MLEVVATPVYMDCMASTPVDERVLDAMLPFFRGQCGNPSSKSHVFGWDAARAVDEGRARVAALIGARPREILFTSGATEANNLAIKGVAEIYGGERRHIVTCAVEHKAVLDCCRALERRGFRVSYVPVDAHGQIGIEALERTLTDETILVSVMAANNEIGTLQPLHKIGALLKERNVLWHCDAAQAAGKIPLDVDALGVDLLSLSAHKMYGPKGAGALYVRSKNPRVRLAAQIEGGGQERNLRSGTLNVPGIVGLGRACQLCAEDMEGEGRRLRGLGKRLREGLMGRLSGVKLNGHPEERLPNNVHLSFSGVDGTALLLSFRDVALSSGSACTSGETSPSHVLRAIGLDDALAHASLRFGLGRFNTEEEVEYVVERVVEEVGRLRAEEVVDKASVI